MTLETLHIDRNPKKLVVYFLEGGFSFKDKNNKFIDDINIALNFKGRYVEIVGNIHENSDLLS